MSQDYKDYSYKDGKVLLNRKETGYSIVEDSIKVYRVKTPDGKFSSAWNKDRAFDYAVGLAQGECELVEGFLQNGGHGLIEAH